MEIPDLKLSTIILSLFALLLLLIASIAFLLVWIRYENPYQLLDRWNGIIRGSCDRQDEPFRSSPVAVMDAALCPLQNIRDFHAQVRIDHDQILEEAVKLMESGGGVPMVEMDMVQAGFFGQTGWRPLWVKFLDGWAPTSKQLPTLRRIAERTEGLFLLHVSVMHSGTVLDLHRGPSRAVYRYHYGLKIPEGNLGLYLDGKKIRWKEREGFIWDDTLIHGSWNKSSEPRLVIFADFKRDLGPLLNAGTEIVYWAVAGSSEVKGASDVLKSYYRKTSLQ